MRTSNSNAIDMSLKISISKSTKEKSKTKTTKNRFFFEKNNFKFFSFFNVEISNLRYRFNQVFFDQIRFELFKFIENIRFDIITTRNEFEKFDSNRVTFEKQKFF